MAVIIRSPATVSDGVYISTMSESNTAAQNWDAFKAGCEAAIAGDLVHFIPRGTYKIGLSDGTQGVVDLAQGQRLHIDSDGAIFEIPSGSQTTPILFTTESGWVDYDVSAVALSTTSGGNMSTLTEVTKVTLATTPPALLQGEMLSLYSNDAILYSTSPYELSYSHEISSLLSVSGSDVFFGSKLKGVYTTSGSGFFTKLRRYNNYQTTFSINNITFRVDGDYQDLTKTAAQRPKTCFEIRGFKNPVVGAGVRFEECWAGTFTINSTDCAEDNSYIGEGLLNEMSNGQSVLGYGMLIDGLNRYPRVLGRLILSGRHTPTTSWIEEGFVTIPTTSYSAGASTVFSYTSSTLRGTPAVGDILYIDMSAATGTINTMPVANYTITARTGNSTSGTFTVAYNSTGLTFTGGSGTARMFQPDQVRRYGWCEGASVDGQFIVNPKGAALDDHEASNGILFENCVVRYAVGYTWGDTSGRVVNNRGANATYRNIDVEGAAQFGQFNSFARQHGRDNTITCEGIKITRQSRSSSQGALFELVGDASVTDRRKLILRDVDISGGAHKIIDLVANSAEVLATDWTFSGDWGYAGGTAYMIEAPAGTSIVCEDWVFDFSDVLTNPEVRIVHLTGGDVTFKRCTFKALCSGTGLDPANTTARYPFQIETNDGSVLTFEDCLFEFATALPSGTAISDGTLRFAFVNDVAASVNFLGKTRLKNAVKLSTTRGLVLTDEAGGAGTASSVITVDEFVTDAEFLVSGTSSDGVVSIVPARRTMLTPFEANTAVSASPNLLRISESGRAFSNEGATASNRHTLPSVSAGITYTFYCQDTDGIRITAASGDTIRVAASVSGAAGYIETTTVGNAVTLLGINATEWVAVSVVGTWTVV